MGKRIHAEFPYIDAEVSTAISGVYIRGITTLGEVGNVCWGKKIVFVGK